jgi:hypothetical protein
MSLIAIGLIVIGLVIMAFGNRLIFFSAGVGALVGVAILHLLPGDQAGLIWWLVPIGLAVLFALGTGVAKGVVRLVALAVGALAGWAIVIEVLDLFGLNLGALGWVLALIGAVIGAALLSRFERLTVLVLAELVGALLVVLGVKILRPSVQGWLATLIWLALAGLGFAYQGGMFSGKKAAKTTPPS